MCFTDLCDSINYNYNRLDGLPFLGFGPFSCYCHILYMVTWRSTWRTNNQFVKLRLLVFTRKYNTHTPDRPCATTAIRPDTAGPENDFPSQRGHRQRASRPHIYWHRMDGLATLAVRIFYKTQTKNINRAMTVSTMKLETLELVRVHFKCRHYAMWRSDMDIVAFMVIFFVIHQYMYDPKMLKQVSGMHNFITATVYVHICTIILDMYT